MPKLQKGDLVDVISPASPVTKEEIDEIAQFLDKKGLKMRFFYEKELVLAQKPKNSFPLDAKARFLQLKKALNSGDSKAIWCVRGGYGSADLIPFLQNEPKITQNKLFIGFSDITALGIFLQQNWGWKIIYGPMIAQLANGKKLTKSAENAIFSLVFGEKSSNLHYNLQNSDFSQKISGTLVGGCLSVLMQSFGTSYEIDFADKILLLEDVGEDGQKTERRFEQLLQIMAHKNSYPKAVLLGNFCQYMNKKSQKDDILQAIEIFKQKSGNKFTIFEDKKKYFGHAKNMRPLLIGEECSLPQISCEIR
jgi:muramoyltetrapeptide carboxypeptidase